MNLWGLKGTYLTRVGKRLHDNLPSCVDHKYSKAALQACDHSILQLLLTWHEGRAERLVVLVGLQTA